MRCLTVVTCLLVLAPLSAFSQPRVDLVEGTLEIAAPANSFVAVVHVSRVPVGFVYQAIAGSELLETDGTGFVSSAPSDGVPEQAIWFVVETQTGSSSLAYPEDVEAEEMAIDPGAVIELDASGVRSRGIQASVWPRLVHYRPPARGTPRRVALRRTSSGSSSRS